MAWELRRFGVLSRRLAWAHSISAALAFAPIVAIAGGFASYNQATAFLLAMLIPLYGISWIAIGWSVRSGVGTREHGKASR